MSYIKLKFWSRQVYSKISLSASKSISARALIIQHLAKKKFDIINLSDADDIKFLSQALSSINSLASKEITEVEVGDSGTAMRFMTALLATKENSHFLLYGSEHLNSRPITELVQSLNSIGADIEFYANSNCAPLKIIGRKFIKDTIEIRGDISSQYVSSLLLIAPTLKNGLTIKLTGTTKVSFSYIKMTISMMREFGISVSMSNHEIRVEPGEYECSDKSYFIESDWSSASYWYGLIALAQDGEIHLNTLFKNSIQGDSEVARFYSTLGVLTEYNSDGTICIRKDNNTPYTIYSEYDFSNTPDIAQTFAVTCAALGLSTKLTGLSTLRIKETNRLHALKTELIKIGVSCDISEDTLSLYGIRSMSLSEVCAHVKTYNDHRMALAFTQLCMVLNEVSIHQHSVVNKSYPNFWNDLFKSESVLMQIISS